MYVICHYSTLLSAILLLATGFTRGSNAAGQTTISKKTCQELFDPVFLERGKLPITALASFQGSGNTWVRQVLAGATGHKTGDIYQSYGDDVYPEFSATHDETVIAIKTHTFADWSTNDVGFKRALLIVRHPLDALYSEFNRMYGGNKTLYADAVHLINTDGSLSWKWDAWMTHIASWVDFYNYWLKEFKGPVHVIYYNNLKLKTFSELSAAIRFLGLEPDIIRLNCTVEHPRPAYFKRPSIAPPVPKTKLFRFSLFKADKAISIFKDLVRERFGEKSETYKRIDLVISVDSLK